MIRKALAAFFAVWLLFAFAVLVSLEPSRPSLAAPVATQDLEPHNLDEQLASIAERVPGFGGFFFDDEGNPTVYLRDMRLSKAVQTEMTKLLAGQGVGRGHAARPVEASSIRVLPGKYDFAQLVRWKLALREALSYPGVVFIYADEQRNRVHVGIEPGTDGTAVKRLAVRLGVPEEAVIFSEVDPF